MHRTSLSGTQRGTWRSWRLRTRTLEDRLARFWTSRGGTRRCARCGRRSFVYRARPCLRHDHARSGCAWYRCYWFGRLRLHRLSGRCRWRCNRDRRRRLWRRNGWRGTGDRRRRSYRHHRFRWNHHGCRRTRCSYAFRSDELRRRSVNRRLGRCGRLWRRWRGGLDRCRRRRWRRHRFRLRPMYRRMRDCFFLLRNCPENIPRTRDVREINLCLDLFLTASGSGRFARRRRRLSVRAEVLAYQLRLVLLQRTGVGLLLGYAYFGEDIKNRLALDLQLPRQIVDSNLTHPPFRFLHRFRYVRMSTSRICV